MFRFPIAARHPAACVAGPLARRTLSLASLAESVNGIVPVQLRGPGGSLPRQRQDSGTASDSGLCVRECLHSMIPSVSLLQLRVDLCSLLTHCVLIGLDQAEGALVGQDLQVDAHGVSASISALTVLGLVDLLEARCCWLLVLY